MYRNRWDYYDMMEWRDVAEALNGVLMARNIALPLSAQDGFAPAPLLPTNLSVRTARV